MKYVICVTLKCNLACRYCYIAKKNSTMPLQKAIEVVDFIFSNNPPEEKLRINFSGGEPLLEFDLIKKMTEIIEQHPCYDPQKVEISITTNGTVFPTETEKYLLDHNVRLCISCDGPPHVHDIFRSFPNQEGSSSVVERTLTMANEAFAGISVHAVYHPETVHYLPLVVEYFLSLGIRRIHLSSDLSAPWTRKDAEILSNIYPRIADRYIEYALKRKPLYISVIDGKMAAFEKGGYESGEKCRLGETGLAFAPSGHIYPCERLIGNDSGRDHCIGNIRSGIQVGRVSHRNTPKFSSDNDCIFCDIKDYCMNWCSCSNYFSSGYYNRVGPFLCASEKTAIRTAFNIRRTLALKTSQNEEPCRRDSGVF